MVRVGGKGPADSQRLSPEDPSDAERVVARPLAISSQIPTCETPQCTVETAKPMGYSWRAAGESTGTGGFYDVLGL